MRLRIEVGLLVLDCYLGRGGGDDEQAGTTASTVELADQYRDDEARVGFH